MFRLSDDLWHAKRTRGITIDSAGGGLPWYADRADPPTVEHVTMVEVRVAVVFVWAPVVVGVVTPQFDVTTISTPGRDELEPTKHPNSLPTTALWSTTAAPDTAGCGP